MSDAPQPDTKIQLLAMYIEQGDLNRFFKTLKSFFSNIPYHIGKRNEAHFQDVVYCISEALSLEVQAEYLTSNGRIDLVIGTKTTIYVMEFKVDKSAKTALEQISQKNYTIPFETDGRKIVKVGASFSSETGTLEEWQCE